MATPIDLTNRVFGRLTVISRAENSVTGQARWNCICTCGGTTVSWSASLRRGRAASCGCGQREAVRAILLARNGKPDDKITYGGAHLRVTRAKGRASTHACADCGQRAAQWSLNHGAPVVFLGVTAKGSVCQFSGNPEDYDPRCAKCHKAYDRE